MYVTIATLSNQTLLITPRHDGQILRFGGVDTVTAAETPVRVYGSGSVQLSSGWWDDLLVTDGFYDGTYFDGSTSDTVEPVRNDVYRQINGGPWVRIAGNIPTNGTIVDPIPTIAGTNRYRAVAYSALPSSAASEAEEVPVSEPGWCFLNYGPSFGMMCRIYGNMNLGGSTDRSKSFHRYAGRTRRTVTFGDPVDQKVTVSGRVTPDASPLSAWEEAEATAEVVAWRDPKGRRIFGVLDGFSHSHETPVLAKISFAVEEVDYDESA